MNSVAASAYRRNSDGNGGAFSAAPQMPAPVRQARKTRRFETTLLPMTGLVMLAQQVAAEVARKVAPHRMDVVGVVLRVVELDQKRGRLNAVVMPLAGLFAARPREVQVAGGLLDLLFPRLGDLVRHVGAIFVEQLLEDLALVRGHLGCLDTARLAFEGGLAGSFGENLLRRFLAHDGDLLLFRRERLEQRAAQILLARQDPQAFARAVLHFGGIGPEETRRVLYFAIHHREILTEVVSFDAIPPGARFRRLAKNREEITLRVAMRAGPVLENPQDFIQAHDGGGLD